SLAHALVCTRAAGLPDTAVELQLLYGMAEPVHASLRQLGFRVRVYAPIGELVPGVAYLVRRLLENTSNESFVRHRFAEGRALDELLHAPNVEQLPALTPLEARPTTDPNRPSEYQPEPVTEWRQETARAVFAEAVEAAATATCIEVPALIAGKLVHTDTTIDSVDPGEV